MATLLKYNLSAEVKEEVKLIKSVVRFIMEDKNVKRY